MNLTTERIGKVGKFLNAPNKVNCPKEQWLENNDSWYDSTTWHPDSRAILCGYIIISLSSAAVRAALGIIYMFMRYEGMSAIWNFIGLGG